MIAGQDDVQIWESTNTHASMIQAFGVGSSQMSPMINASHSCLYLGKMSKMITLTKPPGNLVP